MSQLRLNMITMQWVIVQDDNSALFNARTRGRAKQEKPPVHDPDCPFCKGNEGMSDPPLLVIGSNDDWRVRVLPNKYPVLEPGKSNKRYRDRTKVWMDAAGLHEIVVESPSHRNDISESSVDNILEILLAWRERYEEMRRQNFIQQISIFKNHGPESGATLIHPHSHIVGTPILSSETRRRMERAFSYYETNGRCIFCDVVLQEIEEKTRIVYETDHFVSFIPFAALSPFHTWIFPKYHACSFDMIDDNRLIELARIILDLLMRFHYALSNPSYNFVLRALPPGAGGDNYFHWYFSFVPRLTHKSGFELGSGMHVNTMLPETSAEILRDVNLETTR